MGLNKALAAFFVGAKLPEDITVQPPTDEQTGGTGPFERYADFTLRDGDILVRELEKLNLPFEVELDGGISRVDERFGSYGHEAKMVLYIEWRNREILDDLVKLHFHKTTWSPGGAGLHDRDAEGTVFKQAD